MDGDQSGGDDQSNSGSPIPPNAQQGTGSGTGSDTGADQASGESPGQIGDTQPGSGTDQSSGRHSLAAEARTSQSHSLAADARTRSTTRQTSVIAPGTAPGTAVVTTFHGCGTVNHKGMINILLALALLVLL
ncbi:hypothetical protein LTX96_0004843 [Nakaseomyces glabratus]|nr:hypothetical protein LTX96_0004843 [Nakaseomyces glabratus]